MSELIIVTLIILLLIVISYKIGIKLGGYQRDRYWKAEIPNHRRDAVLRSRHVIGGHFSEQLAPYLPNFPYNPNECRFIGKPIDLIVFEGMDNKQVKEIKFVEIKSGDSKLSEVEKQIKNVIENKKVKWEEYRVPKDLTTKNDFEDRL